MEIILISNQNQNLQPCLGFSYIFLFQYTWTKTYLMGFTLERSVRSTFIVTVLSRWVYIWKIYLPFFRNNLWGVDQKKYKKNSSMLGLPNIIQDGTWCLDLVISLKIFVICLVSMFNWTFLFSNVQSYCQAMLYWKNVPGSKASGWRNVQVRNTHTTIQTASW